MAAFAVQAQPNPTGSAGKSETNEHSDARMDWWREAKFGMFIHWGLYSLLARGEWVMNRENIPIAKYAELTKSFNPVKFNAEEWVKVAKDAGMKYIIITSKHHEGFAMFGSKVSPYNIVEATPFKRDPLKELAEACRKEGIRRCYESPNRPPRTIPESGDVVGAGRLINFLVRRDLSISET